MVATELLFRRLNPTDARLLGIFFEVNNTEATKKTFNPFPLTKEVAAHLLNTENKDLFFGAFIGGEIVAFSMLRGWNEGYNVPSFGIITADRVRGKGIGSRFTAWTVRWSDFIGCPSVRLMVYAENAHALSIYKKNGFHVTEENLQVSGRRRLIMHRAPQNRRTRVYVSTACLPPVEPFFERLNLWRDAGIFSIECGNYPSLSSADAVYALRNVGGDLLLHNYFPPSDENLVLNIASSDNVVRESSIAFINEAIRLSNSLHSNYYAFHAGFCADPNAHDGFGFRFPKVTPKSRRVALDNQTNAVKCLKKYSAEMDVNLLIENNVCIRANKGKVLMADPHEIVKFYQSCKLDVGLLFDTGHWLVSAQTLGFDPNSAEALVPFIQAFHLHENDGICDEHNPMDANSPWVQFASAICPKYVTLEGHYTNLASLQKSLLSVEKKIL